MKIKTTYFFFFTLFCFINIQAVLSQSNTINKTFNPDSVKVINGFYQCGDYYLGGQPTLEDFNWLKSDGVKLVINLRTEKENEQFASASFDEKKLLDEYGINYISIPVTNPDSYNPETLLEFTKSLNNGPGKVLIHCASGRRVKNFFLAYLIQSEGYTLDEAIDFGKKIKYSFPHEDVLGEEIHMLLKE